MEGEEGKEIAVIRSHGAGRNAAGEERREGKGGREDQVSYLG